MVDKVCEGINSFIYMMHGFFVLFSNGLKLHGSKSLGLSWPPGKIPSLSWLCVKRKSCTRK